jgi:hypothetical protein
MILPPEALPLITALAPAFTQPTYRRFITLLLAAVLTTGRRTIADLLRTLGALAPGHRTDYQRVLSRAPWSALELGCALTRFLLAHLLPKGEVVLVGDDTVDGHPGKQVYGKARHRGPASSWWFSVDW